MKEIVTRGCYRWGLAPSPEALERLDRFMHFLLLRNRVMNLTAVTEPEEVARRHFLDCLFLLTVQDFPGKRILDVGCGAGFPTVPLLCYDPGLDITALDATAKRITFVEESCKALELAVSTQVGRAESLGHDPDFRGQFDIVVSRAVAPLGILAELCLPFLKVGGVFLPQKTDNPEAEAELRAALPAIEALGGKATALIPYDIRGLDSRSQVVVIEKLTDTPDTYPRRWARIKEDPLT